MEEKRPLCKIQQTSMPLSVACLSFNCIQLSSFACCLNLSDIALDEPIRDDGFGGEGVDFLADGFGDELGGDALVPGFDDLPTTVAAADVTLEPVDTNLVENKEIPVTEAVEGEGEQFCSTCSTLLRCELHITQYKL